MLLTELFKNDNFDINDVDIMSSTRVWQALAQLSTDSELMVTATKINNHSDTWNIEFSVDDNFGITGAGNEIEIFSMIINILREFLKEKNPLEVIMISADSNRTSLYKRMIRRLLPDWKLIIIELSVEIISAHKKEIPIVIDNDLNARYIEIGGIKLRGDRSSGLHLDKLSDFIKDGQIVYGDLSDELKRLNEE